jgi:hypothetical protein
VRLVASSNDEITLTGTYAYQNGVITFNPLNGLTLYPEVSLAIETYLGMIVHFTAAVSAQGADPNQAILSCYAVGHGYNDSAQEFLRHYDCPLKSQNITYESNAIEFTPQASVHSGLTVAGGIFRHRERDNDQLFDNPLIRRGYGIYRRDGDQYYGYFYNQFDDANLISGTFSSGDMQISVNELGLSGCNFR